MKELSSLDFASIGVLRTFATVVECGSFSQAARLMQLTPSTISKHIHALEAGLQVALIHRTTRKLDVTSAGQNLYERCKVILQEAGQAGLLAGAPAALTGDMRVVAPPSFTTWVLMPRLAGFIAKHPQLAIDLRVSSAPVDLIQEGIDVYISLEDNQRNKAPALKLASNTCVVCASPAYLERFGAPEIPADLKKHAGLIGHGSPYAESWPFMVGRNVKLFSPRRAFASDNGDALRTCCLAGVGLAGFYAFHVAQDLKAGRLVEVLKPYRASPSSVYAIVPHRRYLSPNATAFIEFVRGICGDLGARAP